MVGFWKHLLAVAIVAGALMWVAGCSSDAARDEILLAYSGDCQAYLDPCG